MEELEQLRSELMALRAESNKNPGKIREVKRKIARKLTEMNKMED